MDQDGQSVSWRKSSASQSGNCVEVGADGDEILVRDTKDRSGPALRFTQSEWRAFVTGVLGGEFSIDELKQR